MLRFLGMLALIAMTAASSTSRASLLLSLSSPSDLSQLVVGSPVTIDVELSGLQTSEQVAEELDSLFGSVLFSAELLGTPTLSAGTIVPSPLADPLDFSTAAFAGQADASFLTFDQVALDGLASQAIALTRIIENGLFYSFEVTPLLAGSGTISLDTFALGATQYNSNDPDSPIELILDAGEALSLTVVAVPEPSALLLTLFSTILFGMFWFRKPKTSTRRSKSNKKQSTHRQPRIESLEPRELLAADVLPSNLFAQFIGNAESDSQNETIEVSVSPSQLGMKNSATIGFHLQEYDDSGFDPGQIVIRDAEGNSVPAKVSKSNFQSTLNSDAVDAVLLADLREGDYTIEFLGENDTTGTYQLDLFLPGDADGDHRVTRDDARVIRRSFGASLGSDRYTIAADADLDGRISSRDLRLWSTAYRGSRKAPALATAAEATDPSAATGTIHDGINAVVPQHSIHDDATRQFIEGQFAWGQLAAASTTGAITNLIVGGSFESPTVNHEDNWDIFGPGMIPGWTLDSGAHFELQRGILGGPYEGQQHLELDADQDGPDGTLLPDEQGSIGIFQDIPTIAGQVYKLSFAFGARPGTYAQENVLKIDVTSSGASLVDKELFKMGTGGANWATHEYAFTATGPLTRIRFADAGVNNTLGTFLDDVRLEEINLDLDAVSPYTGTVPDEEEEISGAIIVRPNIDDDDKDGIVDRNDFDGVVGEDNLIELNLDYDEIAGGVYSLSFGANLRLWQSPEKMVGEQIISGEPLPEGLTEVYAEGMVIGEDSVQLELRINGDIKATDLVVISVATLDIEQVPEYLFAQATYSTPIRFTADGLTGNFYVHTMNSQFVKAPSTILLTYATSDRFGANNGFGDRDNGNTDEYTLFLPPSVYNGIELPNDAINNAVFMVAAAVSYRDGGPIWAINSDPQDAEAMVKTFADSSITAFDLPSDGTGNGPQFIDLNSAEQQTNLNSSSVGYYKIWDDFGTLNPKHFDPPHSVIKDSLLGFGGWDEVNATTTNYGNGLETETDLIDRQGWWDDSTEDPPGSDGNVSEVVATTTKGGYFYVSYGGRPVSWLGGEIGMDLGKVFGNYTLDWFSATPSIANSGDHGIAGLDGAQGIANTVWAIGGAIPGVPPAQIIGGIGGLSATILQLAKDEIASQGNASGGLVYGMIGRARPNDQITYSQVGDQITNSSVPLNFSRDNGVINTGDQITFYTAVSSWTKNTTTPAFVYDSIQGNITQLLTEDSAAWRYVKINFGPGNNP